MSRDPIVYAGKAKVLDARLLEARTGSKYLGCEYEAENKQIYSREWYLTPKALGMTKKAMRHHGLDLDADQPLDLMLAALVGTTVHIVVRRGMDDDGRPREVVWPMDEAPSKDAHADALRLLRGDDEDDFEQGFDEVEDEAAVQEVLDG